MSKSASVVSRVKELWGMGWSLRRIAAQLQADGIPSPREGSRWTHTAVKRILDRGAPLSSTEPAPPPEPTGAPVGVMGSVTVQTSGMVTITATGDVATEGPVTVNPNPAAQASPQPAAPLRASRIILPGHATDFPLSAPPALALLLPATFFLRGRG